MSQSLPERPNLGVLKKQAKHLLRDFKQGDAKALLTIKHYFPEHLPFKNLRDAQFALARRYGFSGWLELINYVNSSHSNVLTLADTFVDLACLRYSQDSDLHVDKARRLLKANPSIASANLSAAIVSHNLSYVTEYLTNNPAAVNQASGPRHWPPLMYLAYARASGDGKAALAIADCLLESGADPNAFTVLNEQYRFTVLTGVMGEGEAGLVKQPPHPVAHELAIKLLEAGANPNDSQGLYNTHFSDSGERWLRLLVQYGFDHQARPNWSEGNHQTMFDFLLAAAAAANRLSCVEFLLAEGADPNARCQYTHKKALTNAMLAGNRGIVDALKQAGAKEEPLQPEDQLQLAINQKDVNEIKSLLAQYSELKQARWFKKASVEAIKVLLDSGFSMNTQDHHGLSLLHHLAGEGQLTEVVWLVEHGADITLKDIHYQATPASWAHHTGHYDIRDYLLSVSEDIFELSAFGALDRLIELLAINPMLASYSNSSGNTPLHLVCFFMGLAVGDDIRKRMMMVLIEYGADVDSVNHEGLSSLDFYKKQNNDINTLLLEKLIESH